LAPGHGSGLLSLKLSFVCFAAVRPSRLSTWPAFAGWVAPLRALLKVGLCRVRPSRAFPVRVWNGRATTRLPRVSFPIAPLPYRAVVNYSSGSVIPLLRPVFSGDQVRNYPGSEVASQQQTNRPGLPTIYRDTVFDRAGSQ
jgi:hypothetical protein